jgi:hypothetical protein
MKLKQRRPLQALSLALIATLCHLSVATVWAAPPQVLGKLMTTGGTVSVNGNDTPSGATIASGAAIITPANVGAAVDIGSLGRVELTPDTSAVIEFSGNNIKLILKKGCALLETQQGTTGSVVNDNGALLNTSGEAEEGNPGEANFKRLGSVPARSDGALRRYLPICDLTGKPLGGVGGKVILPTAAGLGAGAIAAIIGGVAGVATVVGIVGTRGGNPSPPRP